jgi:hypothetical protein
MGVTLVLNPGKSTANWEGISHELATWYLPSQ